MSAYLDDEEEAEDVLLVDEEAVNMEWTWNWILRFIDQRFREQCKKLTVQQYGDSYVRFCFGECIILDKSMQPCFMGEGYTTHETNGLVGKDTFHIKGFTDAINEYVKTGQPLYRFHRDLMAYIAECAKM